jgi:hypothetical protein
VVSRKVNYEKGVVHLFEHFWHEVTGPRERTDRHRVALRDSRVRVRKEPATRSGRNRSAGRASSQAAARAAASSVAKGSGVRSARRGTGASGAGTSGTGTGSGAGNWPSAGGAGASSLDQAVRKRPSRSPKPHPLRNGGR